jgi:hypothetical protein
MLAVSQILGDFEVKKVLILSLITGLALLAGSSNISAQDEGIHVVPVELFACKYNEGKGAADLDKATKKWNSWADKNGVDDYAAWILTPYYYGPEQEFDVIWLGAGKTAVALGEIQDAYLNEKDGLHAAFNAVVSCDNHSNYASIRMDASGQTATPADSVLSFSDCKNMEGATSDQIFTGMTGWAAYLKEQGSTTSIFHWYPAYGGGAEEFDFKRIQVFKNFSDLGAAYDRYGNGGGYIKYGELLGELIDCDSNRAYVAKNVRFVQLR